jgi:hypothetical protein
MYTVDVAHLYMGAGRPVGETWDIRIRIFLSRTANAFGPNFGFDCRVVLEAEYVLYGFDVVVEVKVGGWS